MYMYIASLKTINTTGTITLNLLLLLQTLLTAILHQKHRVNVFFSALAGISWTSLITIENNHIWAPTWKRWRLNNNVFRLVSWPD